MIAAVALLFGLRPPDPDRCRILELGCAGGGNLIPMGLSLPKARCVGIDLSARQIADGQAIIDRLELTNVDLRAQSILDVTPEWGQFDYILCHGVYSWVPPVVQAKILEICSQNLTPNGVAYVSYNTFPGWHTRAIIRDMMRFHVARDAPPRERVRQAREFLDFLIESLPAQNTIYSKLLHEEAQELRSQDDSYVLHEQLEEINEPLHFHQFVERAKAHNLQYLNEAKLSTTFLPLSPQTQQKLAAWSKNDIEYEQRLDFLRNQTFRRSLLCHGDVALRRSPTPEALCELYLATRVGIEPASAEPDIRSTAVEHFRAARGSSISTGDPVTKAALLHLCQIWPRIISFDELRQNVIRRLASDAGPHPEFNDETPWQRLAEPLLDCVMPGVVWVYHSAPRVSWEASERPLGCPLARLQAESSEFVTIRTHILVELGGFDRRILTWLDGTRSRDDLIELVARAVDAGEFEFKFDDSADAPAAVNREVLGQILESSLRRLAVARVLIS